MTSVKILASSVVGVGCTLTLVAVVLTLGCAPPAEEMEQPAPDVPHVLVSMHLPKEIFR